MCGAFFMAPPFYPSEKNLSPCPYHHSRISCILLDMDLFSSEQQEHQPLAYRMRPRTLAEYVGQEHIVGEGRLLRRSIQADQLSSVIFYGPPGTGKTTLARVIANTTKSHFTTMNAVLSGVKQLREEIELAQNRLKLYQRRTILFVDEVHRWNKSQQDALLPWVENGTVILIGATTENPFFEVNRALVSRSRIFQLLPLQREHLFQVAHITLSDRERGYGVFNVQFEPGALDHLVDIANGDARSLLNALELAVETTGEQFPPPEGSTITVSMEAAEESIQKKVVLYDKEGDYHFDVISAFIKSVRGSDPDAVLYWLARMLKAGEDPHYIFRRLLISASEDIGLADPQALGVVESAAAAFDRIGLPEGRFHLTQAALYLATCPKSNSTLGFFDALKAIDEEHREVPVHLKDPSRDGEGFGHGQGYLYPHAYRDHWVAQQYLPGDMRNRVFYQPSRQGYEQTIHDEVARKREVQLEAASLDAVPETLTFSPPDTSRDRWLSRLSSSRSSVLEESRSRIFSDLKLTRHSRILEISGTGGILLWEACRRVPEGGVYAVIQDKQTLERSAAYARYLEELQRPVLIQGSLDGFIKEKPDTLLFEAVIGRNALLRTDDQQHLISSAAVLLAPEGQICLTESIPSGSTRLSDCVEAIPSGRFQPESIIPGPEDLKTILLEAEREIYESLQDPDIHLLEKLLEDVHIQEYRYQEERLLSRNDLSRWLTATYKFTGMQADAIIALFQDLAVPWTTREMVISGSNPKHP